ncbi:MAG: hypothetical protein HY900_23265 [Deltaproteobacteria bacterium]|nr:hypothetical protein [Deltaproteobacteria bacterium]
MKLTRVTSILLAAVVILIAGTASSNGRGRDRDKEMPFKAADLFIEFNSTVIDTGVQMFLDADNWRKLTISDPKERKIFEVSGRGTVGRLGLTELFFESVEPGIADLPLVEFLAMFREGEYEFEGITIDGIELESEVEFTHAIPCGPEIMPEEGAVLDPTMPVVIKWGEVTEVVDPAATDAAGEVVCTDPENLGFGEFEVVTYQVIVEGCIPHSSQPGERRVIA